ncbi:putative Transcriptional regulator [Oenococcus oeni]|uniref:ATP-binding protein n=2 Tax=Oenococcus oeni TaxID=1247 RepID=UPI001077B1E3|nr:ATP-binding protein [Oenococcus oeni]AVI94952.1 hypothetical protein AX764_09125 [Oenococcus oeni]SYV98556.1 putative Transcriptional regulator [Oenococcus oeni]SYW04111.1 putative Transcriptional regulator [Oenococcus oeni]SYW19017.1 putative Transcriptional regulator [Oenococcus oeni]VDC15600.1 putative Transcriptional regulator [Oenococcus oeni]
MTKEFSSSQRHEIEETISNWIKGTNFYPSPVGLVKVHTQADSFYIEVKANQDQAYALDDRFYIRNNSESVPASPDRVKKMLAKRKLDQFDKSQSEQQDLTFNYLKELFKKQNINFKPKELGFYSVNNQTFSNTAFLMSDQNNYQVKIAVFKGITVTQFKDRKEISGSTPKQIDESLSFINLNNPLSSKISGQGQRADQKSYPTIAIREAVVNALSHRSYFSKSPVQIEIYDDRLTIMSPGPLPGGLNKEAVLSGITRIRNYGITQILYHLK